jgi:flagellar biosynthesis GTPase FlhF
MHDLYESMIALRHHAVHRTRVNIQALRQWTSDASIFAATLGDSTAAAKYAPLDEYLEVQYRRIEADRREAEDRLLATVKDLAKKRAELDRVEREAMRRFEEEHKQSSERVLVDLDRVIDASDPLDHGLKVSFQETSPTEPSSDILEETVLSEPVLSILEQTSSMKPVSGNSEATSSTMPSSSVLQESSLTESASNNLGETSSTDPISGVFGRLKLWYGA